MIFGKVNQLARYCGLDEQLDKAIEFLQTQNLNDLPLGKTIVNKDLIYVNRFDYETITKNSLEGHMQYTDIHILLEGTEAIGVSDVSVLEEKSCDVQQDFIEFNGDFQCKCVLVAGDFLIAFPEDAHCPKLQSNGSCMVRKLVCKVCVCSETKERGMSKQ